MIDPGQIKMEPGGVGPINIKQEVNPDSIVVEESDLEDEGLDETNTQTGLMTENPFQCPHCAYTSSRKFNFNRHVDKCKDVKSTEGCNFCCSKCGATFRSMNGLNRHTLKDHENKARYKCDVCNSLHHNKSDFLAHITKHKEDKAHKCDMCGSDFRYLSNMKRHRVRCTTFKDKRKGHQCEVCGLVYRRKDMLRDHMNSHSQDKPYPCWADDCQETFNTSGNTPKKKPGRPRKIKQEPDIKKEPKVKKEPKIKQEPKMKQEKITDHLIVKKKRKIDRFKGMSEEEVAKRLLPDHLAPNLDIVIVGINPGLYAAFVGHHYAGPGNHFWKCMFLSGLIPEQMNAMQDSKLLEYGIGFTNIVARTSRGSADLSKKEIKEGAIILAEKLNKYKPKIAVFNGKGIYEVFLGHKNFYFGKQPEPLAGTETAVYVMPSSSARCSQLPRAVDKVPFYAALKKFRDHLKGDLPDLKEEEITFPDLELKTVKKEKKEPVELYPGEVDPSLAASLPEEINKLCGFTSGNYDVIPHGASTTANQSQFLSNASQFSGVNIKQEPGTSTVSEMPMLTQVKQEPGVSDPATSYCTFSHSNVTSHGQFNMYSQPTMSSGSNPMPNSLNGLYGLLGQVTGASQSNFGFVNQGDVSSKQMQFNDALCGIVKEGNGFELPADSCDLAEESQGKKPNARKRKKKSDSSDSSEGLTRSPPQAVHPISHYPPHTSPDSINLPPFTQPDTESVYQPLQAYNPHMYTQAPPPNITQAPPFCLSFPHPSAMSYSQSFAGGHSFHPPGSFTQMLGGDFNAAGIPHTSGSSIPFTMANHQAGIPHTSGSSVPFTIANGQTSAVDTNGMQGAGAMPFGNISIKQEKMDD